MKINLNKNEFELPEEVVTVIDLINWQRVPIVGVAVAVNNKVVPKREWELFRLNEGDKIAIITAVCGG